MPHTCKTQGGSLAEYRLETGNYAKLSLLCYREKFQSVTVSNKHSKKLKFFNSPCKMWSFYNSKVIYVLLPNKINLCHKNFIRKYMNIYTFLPSSTQSFTSVRSGNLIKPRYNSENKTKTNADFQHESKPRKIFLSFQFNSHTSWGQSTVCISPHSFQSFTLIQRNTSTNPYPC